MNDKTDITGLTDEEGMIDLMEFLGQLWQHRIMIALIAFICAAASFVKFNYFTADTYTASGILYISNKKEDLSKDETIQKNDIDTSRSLSAACIEILKTSSFLDDVARNVDGYSGNKIAKLINISSLNETELLKITAKTTDPHDTYSIVGTVMKKAPDKLLSIYKNGEVEIVDPPKYPIHADDNGILTKTVLGAAIGVIIGAAAVFLKNIFDTRVRSGEAAAKRYNVTVLGELPEGD